MTDKRYFLGLDGGGTKTHCVLYDAETDTLEFASGGATNHEALPGGMEALPAALEAIVLPLLARMGLAPGALAAASFGIGGVDTPMQHDLIAAMLSDMGFGSFVLSNDAYLGVKAECGGSGIAAVNGSGYSVVGINALGEMLQIGGHYDMTGDRGGGTYLVPAAIRTAYAALYKHGESTQLTELLEDWSGAAGPEEFCQAVAVRILTDSVAAYHDVSRLLYRAAALGDAPAKRILTESGEDYALSVRCVAERLGMDFPVDVALLGSQFTRCEDPCAIDAMRAALPPERYRLRVISTKPVAGALLWALELAGAAPTQAKRRQLKARVGGLEEP